MKPFWDRLKVELLLTQIVSGLPATFAAVLTVMAAGQPGINIAAVLAGLGVVGLTIGFAAKVAKKALDAAGIEIPFPHLQLFVDGVRPEVWSGAADLAGAVRHGLER
jgi:small-conductance mechanosensitive channel